MMVIAFSETHLDFNSTWMAFFPLWGKTARGSSHCDVAVYVRDCISHKQRIAFIITIVVSVWTQCHTVEGEHLCAPDTGHQHDMISGTTSVVL